jgi:hypothetical protein
LRISPVPDAMDLAGVVAVLRRREWLRVLNGFLELLRKLNSLILLTAERLVLVLIEFFLLVEAGPTDDLSC